MDDAEQAQDRLSQVSVSDEQYDEIANELREIHELQNTKAFLEAENSRLKSQMETLTAELEGINIAISSGEAYIVSYENRRRQCAESVEKLRPQKDAITTEITNVRFKIKAAEEDEESTSNLTDMLKEEIHQIKDEKIVVMKRLCDVERGLKQISSDRDVKLPHLKWYDKMLKQMYNALVETQNRMEVSLILRKR